MAGKSPELHGGGYAADFHVNELACDKAGSLSPFGPELEFPLPVEQLWYAHPRPEDRPHLAGGR